jgi:hypothetical protein
MNPFRIATRCVVAFTGGIGAMLFGSYLWLDHELGHMKW